MSKFDFNAHERKFHVLTAFRLYQNEMYLAQKGTSTEQIKCDKCQHKIDLDLGQFFTDYQTQSSLSVLFETIAVFEPKLYENIKEAEIHVAIASVVTYLTGDKINPETIGVAPKPKPAKSDVDGAIQAKDITNKNVIIPAKTIPKNPRK